MNAKALGLSVGQSTVEYDFDDNPVRGYAGVDRTLVSVWGALGANGNLDAFVAAAYVPSVESELWGGDGDGYMIAGGVRSVVWQQNNGISVHAYGQLSYLDETYDEGNGVHYTYDVAGNVTSAGPLADATGTLMEAVLGALCVSQLGDMMLYGGIEVVPLSDGEAGRLENDAFERSDITSLRGGLAYHTDGFFVSGEAALIGEAGITIRVGKLF